MSGKPASPASSKTTPSPAELWFCFAVREEAVFLEPHRHPVLITGMGTINASRHLSLRLQESKPKVLLTCGFAGALNPAHAVGTVLFNCDDAFPLRHPLEESGAIPSTFHSVDQVVITATEKQHLHNTTGADAVEMESHVLRSLCHEQGIPSATVRVVSDAADEDMPVDFNRLMNRHMKLSFPRLILALMARPSRVKGLLQLQRNTRHAARRLADTLQALMGEWQQGESSTRGPKQ